MGRKLTSLLLALFVCLSFLPLIATAAVTAAVAIEGALIVDQTQAYAGSKITVNVDVADNPGIAGARVYIRYDSKLTLTSAEVGETFAELDYTAPPVLKSGCAFNWDSLDQEITQDGTLLKLTFDVSDSTLADEELKVEVSYAHGDIYNKDLDSLSLEIKNGFVRIIDYIPGDVNGDLTVNGKDVTLIRRLNAGFEVTLNKLAADVNADGTINGKDVTLIRRYNAGFDVELLPSQKECEHSEVIDTAVQPTCTTPGWTEGSHCSLCGKVLVEKTEIPAIGHTYVDGVCHCGAVDEDYGPSLESYSTGLKYSLNGDGSAYIVEGIGECKDADIIIPPTHNQIPVKAIQYSAFRNCKTITSVVIPDSVLIIGNYAFAQCDNLKSVVLPGNLDKIEGGLFHSCTSLTDVSIPKNVTSIGVYAFYMCQTLENIHIPEAVTEIGANAFCNCSALKNIDLPERLVTIGNSAFFNCKQLAEVNLPESVMAIGTESFFQCSNLKSVYIPSGLSEIGEGAFADCARDIQITVAKDNQHYKTVSGSLYTIDGSMLLMYAWGGETSYTIREEVERIGAYAFSHCKLAQVSIPSNVKAIGKKAFYNSNTLKEVILMDGVVTIEDRAFSSCYNLNSVTLPGSLKTIGSYGFDDCTRLKTIKFVGSESEWNAIQKGENWDRNIGEYKLEFSNTPPADKTYLVTFKDYDGKVLGTQTVREGEDAEAPANPKREGYRFRGWDQDYRNVTSDLIVTATYVQYFTVVFKDYDGAVLKTEEVDKGKNALPPDEPSRDGYVFAGWDDSYLSITSDKTITAVYMKQSGNYTVKFVGHDGRVLKIQTDIPFAGSAIAPAEPTRDGYRFVGWDQAYDYITADITVTALYVQQFRVSFVDYDGTVLKDSWVDMGSSVTPPSDPTRAGYVFVGWRGIYTYVYSSQTVQATYAEDSSKAMVHMTNGTGTLGETVSLYVELRNNTGFISASLLVDFDESALKLIAVKDLGIIPGAMHTEQRTSPYALTWENDDRNTNIVSNGRMVELVFEISSYASEGVYDILLSVPRDGIIDANGQSQSFIAVHGFVAVSEGIRDTHKWDKGTIVTDPTEDSTGLIVYTCRVCGETKTEIIDKLSAETTATMNFAYRRRSDEEDE